MSQRCHRDVRTLSHRSDRVDFRKRKKPTTEGGETEEMTSKSARTAPKLHSGGTNLLISIYHQENHSWQGSVQWLDTGQKVHFRSELELVNLMNQAIQASCAETAELRTWEDELTIQAVGG